MNEVLHANIFFVIASLATVVFCILISLVLYQVFKIVRSLRTIIERIEAGSELIAEDAARIREAVSNGGFFTRIIQFIMGSSRGHGRDRRRSRKEEV